MHYVYILKSKTYPGETYIGSTNDLRTRLAQHNSGKSIQPINFDRGNCLLTLHYVREMLRRNLKDI